MKKIANEEKTNLIIVLENRFKNNMQRHKGIEWESVLDKLINDEKILVLYSMEMTGGEPDVVKHDGNNYIFFDCSKETPSQRKSVCYDEEALNSRKKFKPVTSALEMAKNIGGEILTEEEYQYLQTLGDFDLKSSSWLSTPLEIRKMGGALFGDKKYNRTFIYHNGAESYYSSRGFRLSIKI